MTEQNISDVEFKEVPVVVQDPVAYLTNALVLSGYSNPSGWERGLNPEARDPNTDIEHRLFLVNRSLGLFLSEVTDCGDNVIPRMFIAEKQTYSNWCVIVDQGVVPWLNKRFDAKGMLIKETAPEVIQQEVGPLVSEEPLEIVADPEADNQAAVAAEISVDPKNFISGERFVQDVEKPVTDYKVGQVVVLKSGGPEMTITKVDEDDCTLTCAWVDDDGVMKSHNFAKETVTWPRGGPTSIQRG